MQLCYIDESGDTGSFTLDNVNSQPVFLLTALFMPQERLADVTRSVIALKQRYFPKMKPAGDHWHDWLRVEVKGAELRRFIREGGRDNRRLALGFMSRALSILEQNDCKIVSRILVACLHIDKAYAVILKKFGQRLKALQYRYALADGSKRGGIYVQGKSAKLNPLQLFGDPPTVASF